MYFLEFTRPKVRASENTDKGHVLILRIKLDRTKNQSEKSFTITKNPDRKDKNSKIANFTNGEMKKKIDTCKCTKI